MSTTYNRLVKRIEEIDNVSPIVKEYTILVTMDICPFDDMKHYNTPDEALMDAYLDARTKGANKIYVEAWIFEDDCNNGNFLGYTLHNELINPMTTEELTRLKSSRVKIMGDTRTKGREKLSYPDHKPEFELLDIVVTRELEKCQRVESMKIKTLIRHYQEAGYQVSYPIETPSVPEVIVG